MSSRNCKANLLGVYNDGKHTFVGSKEVEQQEGNGEKEAVFKQWRPRRFLLHKFEEAVGGGRVSWGCVTHINGLSFLQTTFKG